MKKLHRFSILAGIILTIVGIVLSIVNGSFQEYYGLVYLGVILAGLGLLNTNKKGPYNN